VKLGKLGKQLRREAGANPKKAAFLGIAALVAVYFWAPLMWKWIGKSNPEPPAVAGVVADTAPAAATPAADVSAKATAPDRASWKQLIQWMHNDPRTMTALPLTNIRDPFESPAIAMAEPAILDPSRPKPPSITPTAAGLVLTSTIIGPQRRIAQINGKIYVVGQMIDAVNEKEGVGAAFRLVEVDPRRAVLESGGQRFDLSIPEPGKSSKIQLLEGSEKAP
jgi:hypothetical protein